MTRALITGAAGFVGRHLFRACLERGWEVVGIDVRPYEYDGGAVQRADLTDREALGRVVRDIDYVFHEGAVSSSPLFEPDPSRGVEVNVMGGLYLLQACLEAGVERVIYASTSSIYGNLPVPWREDVAIPKTPNAYAASKLAFEYLAKAYTTRGELDTVGLRYFSIYGPGEETKGRYANMISQFLWTIRRGDSPAVFGDGTQTRDFTYVDDVVRANFLATKAAAGAVFNVGTGRETSINALVRLLAQKLERPIEPKYEPNPIRNYVYRTLADTSNAEKQLGFSALVSLEEGIDRLVTGEDRRSGRDGGTRNGP